MRIGAVLVGFGRWGENLACVLAGSSRFELAAIVDVNPGRRRVAAARHPGVMVLADIEEALDLSGVAAAALATPPLTLQRLAHISIAKHKHVFIEKPVARTPAEVLELAEKARRAGVNASGRCTCCLEPIPRRDEVSLQPECDWHSHFVAR
jgi:predicted dehydrogenase